MSQKGAPGDNMDQSVWEAEPQVRHDVSDGKRCGSALPAGPCRKTAGASLGRIVGMRNQHILKCGHLLRERDWIVDAQVEVRSEEAKNGCTLAANPRGRRRA